jgi:hypothetical protein
MAAAIATISPMLATNEADKFADFQFGALMDSGLTTMKVNPRFTKSMLQISQPTSTTEKSCCCCCCVRTGLITTVFPRHKIMSFDFTSDEWHVGCKCCTDFVKCCFGLRDERALVLEVRVYIC